MHPPGGGVVVVGGRGSWWAAAWWWSAAGSWSWAAGVVVVGGRRGRGRRSCGRRPVVVVVAVVGRHDHAALGLHVGRVLAEDGVLGAALAAVEAAAAGAGREPPERVAVAAAGLHLGVHLLPPLWSCCRGRSTRRGRTACRRRLCASAIQRRSSARADGEVQAGPALGRVHVAGGEVDVRRLVDEDERVAGVAAVAVRGLLALQAGADEVVRVEALDELRPSRRSRRAAWCRWCSRSASRPGSAARS